VDSTVAATLVHKVVGARLHCVFVDNGLLRFKARAGPAAAEQRGPPAVAGCGLGLIAKQEEQQVSCLWLATLYQHLPLSVKSVRVRFCGPAMRILTMFKSGSCALIDPQHAARTHCSRPW